MVFLILTNETNNNMKKEIGLVLSGGGTKGIAEAGALKFLEEKNITLAVELINEYGFEQEKFTQAVKTFTKETL